MGEIYAVDIPIRFRHCDPAGIVFYPRYFEIFNEVVENWFDDKLDYSFADMMDKYHVGTPLVSVSCDFFKAVRLGETLTFQLSVLKLGNASIEIQLIAQGQDGEEKLRAKLVLVYTKSQQNRYSAADIPEHLKEKIQRYC